MLLEQRNVALFCQNNMETSEHPMQQGSISLIPLHNSLSPN